MITPPKDNPTINLIKAKAIHFVGVGGCGMSGIADILNKQGYTISGSDKTRSPVTHALSKMGVTIYEGHDAKHCEGKEGVVISGAIGEDNPEYVRAKQNNIPIVKRAEMLSQLMSSYHGIAISGTHGKTTTTALAAHIFKVAGLDPSYIIGGALKGEQTGAKLGQGSDFIVEADESDASFLHLNPDVACITNIDLDHMENFNDDPAALTTAFAAFLARLPKTGLAILAHDDAPLMALGVNVSAQVLSYGFNESASVFASNLTANANTMMFEVNGSLVNAPFSVTLNLPGKHNVSNALCAITLALSMQVPVKHIQAALLSFPGTYRRFNATDERFGSCPITVIDDYGHHPKAIHATLSTIRQAYPGRRILHVFQPHRYTRTKALFNDFIAALNEADHVLLLPIYAASEPPITGISSEALAKHIERGQVVPDFAGVMAALKQMVQAEDVLLLQGAGSIGQLTRFITQQR